MSPRWRLILAAAAFLGWMAWLGVAALTKSRDPVVSHAQAAAAKYQVVADVTAGDDGKPSARATVVESPTPGGPAKGTDILVGNLPDASGFDGPGAYLLLVTEHPFLPRVNLDGKELPSLTVVGPQRSPGTEPTAARPVVYRWTDDVRKQAERLRR